MSQVRALYSSFFTLVRYHFYVGIIILYFASRKGVSLLETCFCFALVCERAKERIDIV